jgi:hypothetical protein
METTDSAKHATEYSCQSCDLICSRKNDWDRHLLTVKHLRNSGTFLETKKPARILRCKCGKHYQTKSGLWKHAKICTYKPMKTQYIKNEPSNGTSAAGTSAAGTSAAPAAPPDVEFLTNLVLEVVKNNADLQKQNSDLQKQNSDYHKQMLDLYKTGNGATLNLTNNNSHNKTFNLQFFLNETCKDAMNIMDFVDSMTLDFADLEDVGKLGYVEGISNIIIRKLNEMEVHKRPIHCSDAKREIMFVKDDNVWEKENGNYDRLRKAIKHITKKNGDLMIPWSKENPSCMDIQHKMNDVYLQIMSQSMGGRESFVESENKIMKKIAKAVLIAKT